MLVYQNQVKDSIRPKKSLGQHFLTDEYYCRKIVEFADVSSGDHVLEIGPGTGQLTRFLRQATPDITAIEVDSEMVEFLQGRFGSDGSSFRILHHDALEFDWSSIPEGSLVVGNLPYNIATPLLLKMTPFKYRFQSITCMLQKEVALRILAEVGEADYGFFTLFMRFHYLPEAGFDIPPGAFRPPPRVVSHVLKLIPRREKHRCSEELFEKLISTAFRHRRKTLRNNLKALTLSTLELSEMLKQTGIDLKLRPQQVSLEGYIELTWHLQSILKEKEEKDNAEIH